MTCLKDVFGGAFIPIHAPDSEPPEVQLANAISAAGMDPPIPLLLDGKLHRFDTDKKGAKTGWYIAYGDGIPAGSFGNWKEGFQSSWCADVGRDMTVAEQMAHARRMDELRKERDKQLKRQHDTAADTVQIIWDGAHAAPDDHPYLLRKRVQPHGLRVTGDGRLISPLYKDGDLRSLQYIAGDGVKKFHGQGESTGCYDVVGTGGNRIFVAEGFASAATVFEETGCPCAVAYNAANIPAVVADIRQQYTGPITIVADNDEGGVGKRYADQAGRESSATVVMPPVTGDDINDYRNNGGDALALLLPPKVDWLVPADEFAAQPAPMRWLIKGWLPEDVLAMVHGPPAAGKSFLSLDWGMRIAAGVAEWNGHKVKTGRVVYLAGEGHHGLRGRIAAWKQYNGVGSMDLWVSRSGCDFNTPEGYMRVAEELRQIGDVTLVIVDTLHRFFDGDENSAKDARSMIKACDDLRHEFAATVLLVHHTGVSDEAQHRARGSSAWRGALDVEISVVPAKDGGPIEVVPRKAKDSEMPPPLAFRMTPVEIDGWFDEDGDSVGSIVLTRTEPPAKTATRAEAQTSKAVFEKYWRQYGCEDRGGKPYLSRSALIDGLEGDGAKRSTAEKRCQPSGTLIGPLLAEGWLVECEHGWVVDSVGDVAGMMLTKM